MGTQSGDTASAPEPRKHRYGRQSWPDRNPLGVPYFPVPLELIESGLARQMRASELQRYLTLLRIMNYLGKLSFSVGLEVLGNMDGISPRTAFRVNAKLEERGMVQIDRERNPTNYTMMLPSEWKKPIEGIRLTGTAYNVSTSRRLGVPKWGTGSERQIGWK